MLNQMGNIIKILEKHLEELEADLVADYRAKKSEIIEALIYSINNLKERNKNE